jgi:hypothetical protein
MSKTTKHPIAQAYRIYTHLPKTVKKMRNPRRSAPAVVQAMQHLGPQKLQLSKAQKNARDALGNTKEAKIVYQLDWQQLQQFLSSVALFLKAKTGRGKSEKPMKQFKDRGNKKLASQELNEGALKIAELMSVKDVNGNKLKRLSAHIGNAQDKWQALGSLARFYPLKGVPTKAVDELVTQLEKVDLHSFKELVAQAVIYFEAANKGWKGLEK